MKLRVGFVGAGAMAVKHIKILQQNEQVELVSVCDLAQEQAEKTAQTYSLKSYTRHADMLVQEKLDVLFVCVPPFAHSDIEELAAEQGIHLFVEKPVGLDLETAKAKAEIIKDSGIITSVGYALRYVSSVERAREYLQGKTIGMVRAHNLTGFVNGKPWWRDMSKSGGQLVEQTTHIVDFARYFAGDVQKVYADMDLRHLHDKENITIPDVTSVHLRFKSGAVGHVDSCCIQPDHRMGLEIQGRDFRLVYEGLNLTIVEKDKTETIVNETEDIFKEQDNAFIRAILEQDPSLVRSNFSDAVKSLEVTVAANQSAASGDPVYLD